VGHRPFKIWEGKNVQNSPRFRTTFEFDYKYLWNEWKYRRGVNGVIKHCSYCVEQEKIANFVHTQ